MFIHIILTFPTLQTESRELEGTTWGTVPPSDGWICTDRSRDGTLHILDSDLQQTLVLYSDPH